MSELPTLTLATWGLATALTLFLLLRILLLGLDRTYPLFTLYLGINVLQTIIGVYLYQFHGFRTVSGYRVAWATQALVVVARGLATAETCYRILGKFKGVWALAVRLLIACGGTVLFSTLYFGVRSYQLAVITLDMSLEAFIATWIVGLLLFARYYDVAVQRETRMIALGLGVFSCCNLLNDLLFERHVQAYSSFWNYVSSAAFIGILLLWTWALRRPVTGAAPELHLNSAQVYQLLIPQVNRKLSALNQQLSQFWRAESSEP